MSKMPAVDGSTANPGVSSSAISESDIIGTLRNILARSQAIIPDLETPYSRKFSTTNYSDIELEDQSISAIINERQQQLDITLHDISDLETVMDGIKSLHQKLIEMKDRVTQSMNLHKRLVSAAWRFPTEVLAHIFGYCLPTHHQYVRPASNKAPMLLTRICRRWREVAVYTPSLWCRVRLDSGEVRKRRWRSIAFGYGLWLKRSRGLPLSLEVLCDEGCSDIKLRTILQPYINQISSLSIRVFTWGAAPQHIFNDLPALQELAICEYEAPKDPCLVQFMSQLPFTVCSLKVARPEFNLEDLSTVTPLLAHLTNIELSIDELNMVPRLLRLCPNLSSLTARTCTTRKMQFEPFTHTKLGSLRIAHDLKNTEHLFRLFEALTLPNLRSLEVRYVERWQLFTRLDVLPLPTLSELKFRCANPWPHDQLMALLARSNCPLESLVFRGGVMTTDEQRMGYVSLIPSLEVVVDPMRQV